MHLDLEREERDFFSSPNSIPKFENNKIENNKR